MLNIKKNTSANRIHGFIRSILIIMSLIFMFTGCAPRIQVPVMRPAEINFHGKQRMAIGDFDGNIGQSLSDLLSSKLFTNGYFELVERQNMRNVMREHRLTQMGAIDDSSAIQLGKLTGASVLVYGNASAKYDVNSKRENWKDKKGYHTKYIKEGFARSYATFKVVDMTTGKILAVKNISKDASGYTSDTDQMPYEPDQDAILGEAVSATVDDFIKMIAPYKEFVSVEFASTDSDIPEIESGINFCKMGRWDNGIKQFKAATAKKPMSDSAWFNLGIAYEYSYMFSEAEAAFIQANRIKPNDRCISEIGNIKRMEMDQKSLEKQGISKLK